MKSDWNNGYIFSLFIEATQVKELEFYLLEIVFHVLSMWIAVSPKKASEGENVLFCFMNVYASSADREREVILLT